MLFLDGELPPQLHGDVQLRMVDWEDGLIIPTIQLLSFMS